MTASSNSQYVICDFYCEASTAERTPLPSAYLKKGRGIQSWYSRKFIGCIWSVRSEIKFSMTFVHILQNIILMSLAEDIPLCLKYNIKMKQNMYSVWHNYLFILWLWQTKYIFYFILILSKWLRLLRRWKLYTEVHWVFHTNKFTVYHILV